MLDRTQTARSGKVENNFATAPVELGELCAEIARLHAKNLELSDIEEQLYKELRARCPSKPDVLKWRVADPVSYEYEHLPNSDKVRLWCKSSDIEEKRNQKITRRDFIGTDDQWQTSASDSSLWADVPDERGQARFDEILAAHDAHSKAEEELRASIGIPANDAEWGAVFARLEELVERVAAWPARTAADLSAKAQIAITLNGGSFPKDEADTASMILFSLVEDAAALTQAASH